MSGAGKGVGRGTGVVVPVLRSDRIAAVQLMVDMTGELVHSGTEGAAWVTWRAALLMMRPLVKTHEVYRAARDWILDGTDVRSALWLAEHGIRWSA